MKFLRRLVCSLALLITSTAFAANHRLYLKDGGYHIVREYEVQSDRVRYYSVERSDWEEIPLDLVDLNKTKAEIDKKEARLSEEVKLDAAERKAEAEIRSEIAKIPTDPGVYWVDGKELRTLTAAESRVQTDKKRGILKVITPIPIVSGKATVEIDGEKAALRIHQSRPDFYIGLTQDQRFGMVKLIPKKGVRIVENITIIPVAEEKLEEMNEVEVFRHQVDERLYKIWPQQPLEPGEYAIVEYTEGKVNVQIWDFGVDTIPSAGK